MSRDDQFKRRLLAAPTESLLAEARARRDARGPARTTYSRKVFIPLTQLCADVCHYCTFATRAAQLASALPDAGRGAGDRPRGRGRRAARRRCSPSATRPSAAMRPPATALAELGFERTIDYLAHVRRAGAERNRPAAAHQRRRAGRRTTIARCARCRASPGLMLESASERLCETRRPALRLARQGARRCGSPRSTRRASARMPITSGILIGIGETAEERIDALLALRDLHRAPRPPAGSHRPELPRQAGHQDGAARRADATDDLLRDHRRGADHPRRRGLGAGAAQPQRRPAGRAARRRHRRLGRDLAGHASTM